MPAGITTSHFRQTQIKIAKWLNLAPALVVQKTAIDILSEVIYRTPVDTGRARGSWTVGIDQMPDADDFGVDYLINMNRNIGAINNTPNIARAFIVSFLPYILALENGSSRQAPNGMATIAIQNAIRSLRSLQGPKV